MSVESITSSQSASHIIDSAQTNSRRENNSVISQDNYQSKEIPKKEEIEKIVKGMNDFLQPTNTHIKFEFHEKLQEYYVTIVDNKTEDVIREIPSKKLLDIYSAMTEFLGLVVDKRI